MTNDEVTLTSHSTSNDWQSIQEEQPPILIDDSNGLEQMENRNAFLLNFVMVLPNIGSIKAHPSSFFEKTIQDF